MIRKYRLFILLVAISLIFHSCGPVNFLTKAKRVPLQYSENYNYPNVKSVRSEKNKRAWIVYSDRAGNVTKEIPGGRLDYTELGLMEPLIVIGKKGDYYKLIKYNPAVLKNHRLTNKKAAEYCGWLHKDNLLLFDNSMTEVRNGIKLKSLTSINNSHVIQEADKHFKDNSLMLYEQPKLEKPTGVLTELNKVVYVLKFGDNDSKAFISYQTKITPETAKSLVVGWIDANLVAPMGQRLILNHAPMVENMAYRIDSINYDSLRSVVSPLKSLYPVVFADRLGDSLVFRSLDESSAIDRSNNRIFNVNGGQINYNESKIIADKLTNVNVIFAFDPTKNVVAQMPMLTNAILNAKQVFEKSPSGFNYNFASVLGTSVIPFENNYLNVSDKIIEAAERLEEDNRITPNLILFNAIKMAEKMPEAINLIVYVGEKSSASERSSQAIVNGFIDNNCRLLSYQVYSDSSSDTYNNFVLQSAAIIESYADAAKVHKRNVIVYPDQLCKTNDFRENIKNVYALDFPKRSTTQGMVIFPEKTQAVEPELLISGIDSIVRQIEYDNLNIISSMELAFQQVGYHRSSYDSIFASRFNIKQDTKIDPALVKVFDKAPPQWVSITPRIHIPVDSLNISRSGLLLTETELHEVVGFIDQLSAVQLDVKGEITSSGKKIKKVKKVRKELRGVPADSQLELQYSSVSDTLSTEKEYVNSKIVRKHIRNTYLQELKQCVIKGSPKKLKLAEAGEYITTLPSIDPVLTKLRIKDLKKKRKLSDAKLEELIDYFEESKKMIEEQKKPVDELGMEGGYKYFFVPKTALP